MTMSDYTERYNKKRNNDKEGKQKKKKEEKKKKKKLSLIFADWISMGPWVTKTESSPPKWIEEKLT